MWISIVVPILNEEEELPGLLESLRPLGSAVEVVFVDGGSPDRSPTILRGAGYRLIECAAGRARQMNVGAQRAGGDVLVFLHADTRLSPSGLEALRAAMSDPRIVGGRFDIAYDTTDWPYPWIARLGNLRSRFTGIFTGDQTIFVRREAFEAAGGFPEIPLMEDVEFSRQLKRLGRVACLHTPVVGSTRKWRREGVWRTVALMWVVRALYALGASSERLHRLYYRRDPSKRPSQRAEVGGPRPQLPGSA